MKSVCAILLAVGLPTSGAWAQEEIAASASTASVSVPGEVRERLSRLLSGMPGLGAEPTEGALFYSAANLYEYINGAAEGFIGYDFAALIHGLYKKDDVEVTVDIYDMGDAVNGFGIYTAERSPDSRFIAIGAEGYAGDFVLNFLQGQYYVKLSGFSDQQKVGPVLEEFARAISDHMPTGNSLPAALALFPAENLLPHTQTYVKRSPLGREFLAPAYQAKYLLGGRETTVVLSGAGTATEARNLVERLREHLRKTGEVGPAERLAPDAFRASTRYEGVVIAFPQGRYAVILLNPPDQPEEFLRRLAVRLSSSK